MRRTRHNVYANRTTAAYAVVWNLEWHVTTCQRLELRSDLYEALTATIDRLSAIGYRLTADGWQAECEHEHGFAFVRRGAERRLVMVTGRDPYSAGRQSFDPFGGQNSSGN
jgi:hypothetical protein